VAILDFDVHHGNGTQDIFWTDPRLPEYPDPLLAGADRLIARGIVLGA
jgi:acetoin utilization deacetylase AcuC-like enzyme